MFKIVTKTNFNRNKHLYLFFRFWKNIVSSKSSIMTQLKVFVAIDLEFFPLQRKTVHANNSPMT